MVLTVGTNSYVSLVEAEDYFAETLDADAWKASEDTVKEAALITATRYVDERPWIGSAISVSQSLGWPRRGAGYFDEKLGLMVYPSITEIPERIKFAVLEQAAYIIENKDELKATGQVFEQITVGPISLSDANPSSNSRISKSSSKMLKLLSPLVRKHVGGNTWWRAW